MVRKFAALFALILTFGLAAAPVAAQDVNADDLSELGLESGYLRMYVADPTAEGANPELLGVMVIGMEFDSVNTAEDAFEEFTCGFAGGFLGTTDVLDCDGLVDAGFDVEGNIAISDAPAIEITGEADLSGPTPTNLLAVQSENFIFLVIHIGDDSPEIGDEFATYLVETEPVDTEVEFNADGTSTGGFFDMLPQEGDALLEGFMPALDQDVFNMDTATPAA